MLLPDQLARMRLGIHPGWAPQSVRPRVAATLALPPSAFGRMVATPRVAGNNTQIGDCFPTACVNAVQTVIARAGDDEALTDALAIETYEDMAGYNPAQSSTDQGTDPDKGFSWWADNAIAGYQLTGLAAIAPNDETGIRAEISRVGGVGGVLLCVNLSTDQQNQRVWMPTGAQGSWGGHAIWADSYDGGLTNITSWGEAFYVDRSFFNSPGFVLGVFALNLERKIS